MIINGKLIPFEDMSIRSQFNLVIANCFLPLTPRKMPEEMPNLDIDEEDDLPDIPEETRFENPTTLRSSHKPTEQRESVNVTYCEPDRRR